jgi:putative ABC transport system permease protein
MSLLTIAWKSIRQRSLASILTALSVALGVALMVAVLVINGVVARMFSQSGSGYHLVVGPHQGGATELVLSTVYRTQLPRNNLPWRFYTELIKRREIETAIPITMGDFTEEGGFPIVGTVPRYFAIPYGHGRVRAFWPAVKEFLGFERRPVVPQNFRIRGEILTSDWDAVIGSEVARKNGWDIGSKFKMVHGGLASEDAHVHDEEFTVRGVLAPTGTANDRSVFVHLEGFFAISGHDKPINEAIERVAQFFGMSIEEVEAEYADDIAHAREDEAGGHDHAHHHHHATPDLQKEVSAILVITRTDPAAILLASQLAEGVQAQGVNPVLVMRNLMENLVGNIRLALMVLTGLIILVSGIGIFVSIYNSMSDRKREIAIMRALGASRRTVFSVILFESILLCVVGGIVGLILGHGLVFVASPIVAARSGLIIDPYHFESVELLLFPILIAMASLVGFLPGLTAYRTDVAKALYG